MRSERGLRPLRDAAASAWGTTRRAFRLAPGLAAGVWLSTLVVMAIPSLQVLLVLWVSGEQGPGAHPHGMALFAAISLVTLSAVGMGVASSVAQNLQTLLQYRLRAEYQAEFSTALARATPKQTLDSEFETRVRAVRDAIPFNVSWQATSATTVMGAVAAMGLLAASLWDIHPVGAVLIALALVPDLLTHSSLAHRENDVWLAQGEVSRRATYLEQLQDFQPSNTELSASLGAFGIPAEAGAHHREYARLWSIVPHAALRLVGVSSLAVAALAGTAFALILADANRPSAAVPAALLGLISGLAVTRSAGSAFGELMSSTPLVLAHRGLLAELDGSPLLSRVPGPLGVRVNAVSYTYGAAEAATKTSGPRLALDHVSVTIAPGSIVALVGENGSGKTTLAKIIAGILEPTQGVVELTDSHLSDDARSPLARLGATSMVFQDFTRFELTIRQFVDPSLAHTDDETIDALRRARAWDYLADAPQCLDSRLGSQWGGIGLSGGQWQRLVLARTFLSDAPLWILDEPTAAIDATAERLIYDDLLHSRPPGTTVVVISHRPRTLVQMDRIVVLEHGRILECGTYEELLSRNGALSRLVRATLE